MLDTLLNITKKDVENSFKVNPYIRVLGVNDKGKALLSNLSQNKKLTIITSPKKFLDNNKNKLLGNMFEKDLFASNIYTLGYSKNPKSNLDYTKKFITIK